MIARTLFLPTIALACPAGAAGVVIDLRDARGAPLTDVVVTVHATGRPTPRPEGLPWGAQVVQRNIQFQPAVMLVPVGATVGFPNQDAVRHHVYSFSKPKRFELKLYGREAARTVTFDKPGTVTLGCNIHDRMRGFLRVVDTAWAGKSDARGRVAIDGVTPGAATITVWHGAARAKGQEASFAVVVPASGELARAITVPLRDR
ncbi:MAG: Protein containing plastocyanin/azurin family domain [uncultured Sphingomonadaceae bacterium]|uniref:Protein containing plastocyanin/azurin family domain n=1 Tax=uncultured Sphingomonadaceae bacterium TaxID=169976 RepID=A0A6J4SJ23_9SPHN|nr:MAG: Protein containing plastocyanin/azurin family domain [uncultured Sphingomonadaceae bacterium]